MNANVYQHFRSDEHPFIDSAQGWIEQVQMQYAPYLTDFLDPRQAYILESLIRQSTDLSFQFFGGYEAAERRRCLIYPDYYQPASEEFDLVLFTIIYPKKFTVLSHGKVLGTLMGTGVKRNTLVTSFLMGKIGKYLWQAKSVILSKHRSIKSGMSQFASKKRSTRN